MRWICHPSAAYSRLACRLQGFQYVLRIYHIYTGLTPCTWIFHPFGVRRRQSDFVYKENAALRMERGIALWRYVCRYTTMCKRQCYFIFSIACCRSAMMSSAFSMPTERRMRSGATPASRSCSSESWRCVWLAGWRTQVRASAT